MTLFVRQILYDFTIPQKESSLETFNSYFCAKSGECCCDLAADALYWLEKEREYLSANTTGNARKSTNPRKDAVSLVDEKEEEDHCE